MLQELIRYYDDYCTEIRQEAENMRRKEMPQITEELFRVYEETGNRLIYETVYFQRRKYLAVFGLKGILDGEEGDLLKLEEVLGEICREECWALPAHVNRKTDPDWRICIDLFAAETAQALSEVTCLLRDKISKETADMVRREVMGRVLHPFSRSVAPYGNWEYGESNWCAVCGGSIGSAGIYMMQDEPEALCGLLDRICYSLETYYLKSFAEDGTCLEGLGYFTYGMTYYAGFAQQLKEFTKGRKDLFCGRKLAEIAAFQAKCYFPSGKTVSFADGFTDDTFRPGLACFLSMKYPGAGMPPMDRAAGLNDDNCYRFMGLYRNLTWTRAYIDFLQRTGAGTAGNPAGEKDFSCHIVLPEAQWSICRSKNGAGMAVKGGHNGEPHNHNDVGSFFYLNGGDFLLEDLGCGEYTRDYFSEKRYEYLCCRSLGHNVPLIGGREQLPGAEYGCCRFAADGAGRTVISFAGAYAHPGLESLVRTLDWDKEKGSLWVEDCFGGTGSMLSVKENLITRWEPEIRGNLIRIEGSQRSCLITVEGPEVLIHCTCRVFRDHEGVCRQVWLLQWQVPPEGRAGRLRARFRIEPSEP